ncbi:response regulator [Maridesulfovibrio sp.]|uniref:response regulator n=1 Tax=Maridesulfovibrio sp. TaxID=2795000 RepID=UPI002A188ED7|nr:response regulator [Maridesulfovibrio sp.]
MKSVHVLLVDDENDFLIAYKRRLIRRNVEVSVASSGLAALRMVEDTDYDAIVLDILMPEMNGIETLKRLRAVKPEIPVIILTGHANMEALAQVTGGGAFDYLLKPVSTEELYFKIMDAVREARIRIR